MTKEELRRALEGKEKKDRKALSRFVMEIEAEDPETYREILSRKDWQGRESDLYKHYHKANILSRVTLILAVLVVIAAYLTGDFGMRLFTGWLNRYILAIGIVIAMGMFAGSSLLLNYYKERLIGTAMLKNME
jgi:hypothetical protein